MVSASEVRVERAGIRPNLVLVNLGVAERVDVSADATCGDLNH